MIDFLIFKQDYRTFKAKEMFFFTKGVNLLVGDQGCGKSTLLQVLCTLGSVKKAFWKRDVSIRDMKEVATAGVTEAKRVFAHDYENDSPRTASSFDTMGMLPMEVSMGHMRMSHGQSTNKMVELIATFKDSYLILDEPDSGLSCRSALALVDALKKAEAQGCQVIASVHHPWVIEAFPMVYSVEHRKLMESQDFLAALREPAVPIPSPTQKTKTDKT